MSTLLQDLRFAARAFLRRPAFTAVAVLTLALGIGLNTAVFSAVDALLLRPVPGVRSPDELVQLFRSYPGGFDYGSNSIPHYRDLRERASGVFSDVAVWTYASANLSAGGRTERIMAQIVSANFFRLYGVGAARGRTFVAEEDAKPGAHPVAVLSHASWQGMFAGDPAVVGRTVLLNGNRYTIVGVAAPDFRGPIAMAVPVLWVPLMQLDQIHPGSAARFEDRGTGCDRGFDDGGVI